MDAGSQRAGATFGHHEHDRVPPGRTHEAADRRIDVPVGRRDHLAVRVFVAGQHVGPEIMLRHRHVYEVRHREVPIRGVQQELECFRSPRRFDVEQIDVIRFAASAGCRCVDAVAAACGNQAVMQVGRREEVARRHRVRPPRHDDAIELGWGPGERQVQQGRPQARAAQASPDRGCSQRGARGLVEHTVRAALPVIEDAVPSSVYPGEDVRPAVRRDQRRLCMHMTARSRLHQGGDVG